MENVKDCPVFLLGVPESLYETVKDLFYELYNDNKVFVKIDVLPLEQSSYNLIILNIDELNISDENIDNSCDHLRDRIDDVVEPYTPYLRDYGEIIVCSSNLGWLRTNLGPGYYIYKPTRRSLKGGVLYEIENYTSLDLEAY